jgi:predicted dehydrogenase
MVKRVLAAGKACLSEKPLAPSVAEARKLVKVAARLCAAPSASSSVAWLVGENFAFMPAIAKLAGWVAAGKLGELRLAEIKQMTWMDRKNPYFQTAWRQAPQHVGGFLVDGGVHLAHALRRVMGMPEVTKNLTAQFDPALPPLDTAVAVLRFPSGALGTWTSCFSAHYSGPMLRVFGSKGTAELFWNHVVLRSAKGKETLFRTEVDSFDAQFSHFRDVVKKGAPLAYTPDEALLDLTLIENIVR